MTARATAPDLAPAERRAARDAGAWGLALFSAGTNLLAALAIVALVLAATEAIVREILGEAPGIGDAVQAWLVGIDPWPFVWVAVVVVLVAAGLMALGVRASIRRLQRAGIEPAARITWWCCLMGTLVQTLLSLASGWIATLVGLLAGAVGLVVVVLLYVVVSTALTTLVGYLAGPWLWVRRTRRMRVPTAVAPTV